MKLHKTLLLKIVEPNKGKRQKLENTINLYAEVLKFYLDVIPKLGMYLIASMDNKSAPHISGISHRPHKSSPQSTLPNLLRCSDRHKKECYQQSGGDGKELPF